MLSGLPSAVRGALWMGGALLSFMLMAVAVRELLRTLGSFEIVFLRSLVSLLMVLAVLPWFGMRALRTRHFGVHLARNVFHYGGQFAWVYAIGMLPLATVFAIEFTMPVWTAVLAVLILGERLDRGRAAMLALGIAGILIILKPGFAQVPPAALVMLGGSFAYAATMIATKRLAGHDTAFAVLFYMSAIQVPLGLLPALPGWVNPGLAELPWIIAVGASGLAAHFCLTRALRAADATLVVPIDFLRLPLIAVVGMALYGEALEITTLLGAAVIFSGTYYSIRRESRTAKRP
ncbi:MAG TPA: DMT family transporter [Burkholderiales bacterium]|nr:DMT family transporter [Burkholderiales bacterium]